MVRATVLNRCQEFEVLCSADKLLWLSSWLNISMEKICLVVLVSYLSPHNFRKGLKLPYPTSLRSVIPQGVHPLNGMVHGALRSVLHFLRLCAPYQVNFLLGVD